MLIVPLIIFLRRTSCIRVCMSWFIQRTSKSSGETCTGLWILLLPLHLTLPRTLPKVITLLLHDTFICNHSKTVRSCWDWILWTETLVWRANHTPSKGIMILARKFEEMKVQQYLTLDCNNIFFAKSALKQQHLQGNIYFDHLRRFKGDWV